MTAAHKLIAKNTGLTFTMLLRVLSSSQAEWSVLQPWALEWALMESISQICSEPGDRAAAASHLCPRITLFTHTGWALPLPSPEGQLIRETFPREFISRESLCVISYPVLPLICPQALTSNWQHPTQLLLSTLLNYSTHSEWEGGLILVSPVSSEHNRMEIRELDKNWFPFSMNLLN